MSYLTAKKSIQMNYIAQNITTKELFYSKGASKLAEMIGISEKTIQRNAKHTFTTKEYNGYIFAKAKTIPNKNRGTNIKEENKRIQSQSQ